MGKSPPTTLYGKMPFVILSTKECDKYNLILHKYVCITTYQPDTKSNPNPNPIPDPTTIQHAIVNIQLNIVVCTTNSYKTML